MLLTVRYFVMMYARTVLPLLMLALFTATGCRKEQDEQGPLIEVIQPAGTSTLTIPDTLHVSVHVSDDKIVEDLWMSLVDVNGVTIAPSITVQVNAPSATIDRQIVVSNESIASGSYRLVVRASDGTNDASAFRTVNIAEAPLRLRAIFLTSSSGEILKIDSAGVQSSFSSFNMISEAEINSYTQELFIAAGPFDDLDVLALNSDGDGWQLANQNAGSIPYFTSIFTDPADYRTYVSSSEGYVRGFNGNGYMQFNAQALPGFRPYTGVVAGDRVVSEQHAIALDEKRLACYTYNSGTLLEQYSLDLDVVRMFRYSDQQVLVLGNRNGEGVIQLRNIVQGGIYEMRVFDQGEIRSVDRLSTTTLVVALDNELIRFDHANNSVVTLISQSFGDVAYDIAGGAILAPTGQDLLVIEPATGAIVNTISTPIEIDRILPLFNR